MAPNGRSVVGGSVHAALVLGCSVYDPILIEPSDAAAVPRRPAASTSSVDDGESIVFALNDIFLRQSADDAAASGSTSTAMVDDGPRRRDLRAAD